MSHDLVMIGVLHPDIEHSKITTWKINSGFQFIWRLITRLLNMELDISLKLNTHTLVFFILYTQSKNKRFTERIVSHEQNMENVRHPLVIIDWGWAR